MIKWTYSREAKLKLQTIVDNSKFPIPRDIYNILIKIFLMEINTVEAIW